LPSCTFNFFRCIYSVIWYSLTFNFFSYKNKIAIPSNKIRLVTLH
jgi:hypothetical protein